MTYYANENPGDFDWEAELERRREDDERWEAAWSTYGNGAALEVFDLHD